MRKLVLVAGLFASALLISVSSAEHDPVRPKPVPTAKPTRVMSMNQCTDQIVLALLPPERIASVSWLSRDPNGSLMHREAMRVAVNRGLSEEVVRQSPDLVIAGSFTTPATRHMLKRLGYPLIEVDHANSFDDIRRITRQIADAVGEREQAEKLIADMDSKLASLAVHTAPPMRVAAWDGAGFNASQGSLYNAVLEAAGAINVANEPPAIHYGRPDIEVLMASAPTLLVKGAGVTRPAGLRDNKERHPLIRRYWDGDRTLTIRQATYICGTPMVADAAVQLRDDLLGAAARVPITNPFVSDVAL